MRTNRSAYATTDSPPTPESVMRMCMALAVELEPAGHEVDQDGDVMILERVEGGILQLQSHEIQSRFCGPRPHRSRCRIADLRQERERTAAGKLSAEGRGAAVVDAPQR